ncbi:MAG: iron-containing alcohol dehydrogenase [Oscillospiraceae bacterium]|nr:iron-containing alcohol dehydrogenase [Oscillospiraceae bacterium]
MNSFQFYLKTEVVFGAGALAQTAALTKKHGGSKVLVVYGGGSCKRSGVLDTVTQALQEQGIAYRLFGGARPNPRLDHARKGVKEALDFGADLILAIGGGSSIDTAKAIAVGAAAPDTDIWLFWLRKAVPQKSLPVGVVLTIPAAGSETSDSAVLTDEQTMTKRGLSTDLNRPAFAVLDPTLAATLPNYQVSCGVTDILMHTLDRYFNPVSDNEISDAMAEALLRVVLKNGTKVCADPADTHAMSEIMWCGSLSHNGLTGLGGQKDFAVHQLGHALSARYDVAHGASLSAVWGAWALAVADADGYARFARFGRNVWGIAEPDDKTAALKAIDRQVAYFESLQMPTSLPQLQVGSVDVQELAELCSYGKTRSIGSFKVLDHEKILAVYAAANQEK